MEENKKSKDILDFYFDDNFTLFYQKELGIEDQLITEIQENEEEKVDNKGITHSLLEELNKNLKKEQTTTSNTKRGRIKMNDSNTETHTKDAKDNKVRKIRIHAIKFGINLINDVIKNKLKKRNLILRGISKKITSDISITFNNVFFESTLAHIYSNPVNEKYKNCDKDENKKVINKLSELNHPILNKLLNMKFIDFYNNIFISSNKKDLIEDYGLSSAKNFQDFLDELKKDTDEYKQDLKETAYNIKKHFIQGNARNNNKNENKFEGTNFKDSFMKK